MQFSAFTPSHCPQWFDLIKWMAFGFIEAEEQGVASDNLQQLRTSPAPAIRHLLGSEENLGALLLSSGH